MRKPLGRLAVAVLASVAIPLSFVPAASAADEYNAPSVSVAAFADNSATGVDIGGGYGMLRINSTAGEPLDLTSADFEVVGAVFQASEDSRSWEAKVRFHGTKSFKKNKSSISWHCGGGGHPTKPTTPKSTPTTPKTTETTPSTPDTTPSDTPTSSVTPTSDTPTSSESPTSSETTPTDTPTTSESPSSSETAPPSDTTTSAPTSDTTPPSGGTVTCPVKPVGSSTPSGPQQVVRPVKAPETGFGGMA